MQVSEENQSYIQGLSMDDVPWNRLSTPYTRSTNLPGYLATLEQMGSSEAIERSLRGIIPNIEHQGTLWSCTPFGMVFLSRILGKALAQSHENEVAKFLAEQLLFFFECMIQICNGMKTMDHSNPLPRFSDMLEERYLLPADVEEDEDDVDDVPGALFYSFYYYTVQTIKFYRPVFENNAPGEMAEKVASALSALE